MDVHYSRLSFPIGNGAPFGRRENRRIDLTAIVSGPFATQIVRRGDVGVGVDDLEARARALDLGSGGGSGGHRILFFCECSYE